MAVVGFGPRPYRVDRGGAAPRGVALPPVRRRGLVRAVVVLGGALGLLFALIIGWGSVAGATQGAPIPSGTAMDDGAQAVCNIELDQFTSLPTYGDPSWGLSYFGYIADNCNVDPVDGGYPYRVVVDALTANGSQWESEDVNDPQGGGNFVESDGTSNTCDENDESGFRPCVGSSTWPMPAGQGLAGLGQVCIDDEPNAVAWDSAAPGIWPLCSQLVANPEEFECELWIIGEGNQGSCDISDVTFANDFPSSAVWGTLPPEPYPYWSGQPVSEAPYTPAAVCTVVSFSTQTGRYDINCVWSNPRGIGPVAPGVCSAVDWAIPANSYTLDDTSFDPVLTTDGSWEGNFTGILSNPGDNDDGGGYTFTCTAGDADGDTAVMLVTMANKGVTPRSGTVCPDGPGTCANVGLCDGDLGQLNISFSFLGSWTIPFDVPVDMDWFSCIAKQVGEWAAFPQEGALDDWENFGTAAKTHVPSVYLYDGSAWVFEFTNRLHTDIPGDYTGSSGSCLLVTPSGLPDGSGGHIDTASATMCGDGSSSVTTAKIDAGSADAELLLEVLLVLGFALGMIALAAKLMRF